MKVLDDGHLGRALGIELSKLEVSLKKDVSTGTLLDYGSGVYEWVQVLPTRFTRSPSAIGGGLYLHNDFFNVSLPFTPNEVIGIVCNLETDDVIMNKSVSGKYVTPNRIRLDYAGVSSQSSFNNVTREVKVYLRVVFKQ